ncbi:MAG: Uma2 family endonuclease [Bacteroidota bacterium]
MVKQSKEYQVDEIEVDDISLLDPAGTYSYSDYLKWRFEERVELIKGKLFRMSPAPNRGHQGVNRNILVDFSNYLKGKACKVYGAPFDVRFPEKKGLSDKQTFTVVQPDICVVCNTEILDDAGCNGAPDLIVEILSPSTSKKDLSNKFDLYEEFKVKEYWVVYQTEQIVEVYYLVNDKYSSSKKYLPGDKVETGVLEGINLMVDEIFSDL